MKFITTRYFSTGFSSDSEEFGDKFDADGILDAVNIIKGSNFLIKNEIYFYRIDEQSNSAGYEITNRSRYEGDLFSVDLVTT